MPNKTPELPKVVDATSRYKFMRFLKNDVLNKFKPNNKVM